MPAATSLPTRAACARHTDAATPASRSSSTVWSRPRTRGGTARARGGAPPGSATAAGCTPTWATCRSGCATTPAATLAANGAALAALLTRLVRAWPATVEELVLVGHSMGGLVILSALAQSDEAASLPVRAAITLGSPRHGAPLERHADAVERRTRSVPRRQVGGGILRLRSEGIKDLHGGAGPTSLACPPTVGQYAVLSTITPRPTSAVGARIGDGLVPVPARHTVETAVLGGLHHLDLLNHPRVYERLTTWLAPAAPAAGTAVAAR